MTTTGEGAERIPMFEARKRLTRLPEELAGEHRAVAVTRRGEPVLAIIPWELFEAIGETLDIMGDPELMAALRRSIREADEGKIIPLENAKGELGIDS